MKSIFKTKTNQKLRPFGPSSLRAFTLVETLVAITVLLLSIAAPLSIAANALFSAYYARDQITAYYLAAEAIEYIKNSRDTTFLNDILNPAVPVEENTNWLLGLEDCIESGVGFKGCYVDATKTFNPYNRVDANDIQSCTGGGLSDCPPLDFCQSTASNIDSGLWGYNIATVCQNAPIKSKFTRSVVIKPQANVTGNQEALIKVTVTWTGAGLVSGEQSFTLNGAMFDWERK